MQQQQKRSNLCFTSANVSECMQNAPLHPQPQPQRSFQTLVHTNSSNALPIITDVAIHSFPRLSDPRRSSISHSDHVIHKSSRLRSEPSDRRRRSVPSHLIPSQPVQAAVARERHFPPLTSCCMSWRNKVQNLSNRERILWDFCVE